jgi:hypothetical protein
MKLSTASFHLLLSLLTSSVANGSIESQDDANLLTISSLDNFPYDENNHLASHILAIPSRCHDKLDDPRVPNHIFHHQKVLLEGEASDAVFGHLLLGDNNDEGACAAVCLEKGTNKSVVARPLPHRYWLDGKVDQDGDGRRVEDMTLLDFIYSDGCGKVEYGMVNYHERVS